MWTTLLEVETIAVSLEDRQIPGDYCGVAPPTIQISIIFK